MGVTKEGNNFRVRISKDGVRHNLGSFKSELSAKRALNKWKRDNREPEVQLPYKPHPAQSDIAEDFLGRPLHKKPTIRERVSNAFNRIRSSAGTKE